MAVEGGVGLGLAAARPRTAAAEEAAAARVGEEAAAARVGPRLV
jgi:hypothetical protein